MLCGLSSLTCGENGEGPGAMAMRAATDGYNSVPPGGDEGFGSGVEAATAVIDGQGSVLAWSPCPAVARVCRRGCDGTSGGYGAGIGPAGSGPAVPARGEGLGVHGVVAA